MNKISPYFASFLILSLWLSVSSLSFAQSFERKVFSNGSGQGAIGLTNYHYTFGEPLIGPLSSGLPDMTMGFHQPIPTTVLSNHLLSLEGRWQSPVTELEWSIQHHILGSRFLIQRAVDGQDFVSVGALQSDQQSSTSYAFDDSGAGQFAGKKLWYKVMWVSQSGQIINSDMVAVLIPDQANVRWDLYPNPTTDQVFMRFNFLESAPVLLRFVNPLGQIVREMNILDSAQGQVYSISLESLAAGTYLVWLIRPNSTSKQRLVIAR